MLAAIRQRLSSALVPTTLGSYAHKLSWGPRACRLMSSTPEAPTPQASTPEPAQPKADPKTVTATLVASFSGALATILACEKVLNKTDKANPKGV